MIKEWYWANKPDGCHFHGPHETKEEAISEAEIESDPGDDIYVGHSDDIDIAAGVSAEHLLESIGEHLYDELPEDSLPEDWCHKVEPEKMAAFQKDLSDLVRTHVDSFGFETSWPCINRAEQVERIVKNVSSEVPDGK